MLTKCTQITKNHYNSKFMTETFNCSNIMKNITSNDSRRWNCRPQIISKKQNKLIYEILAKYYKISKIPNLINTSFNMHEEPIVCSPNDAIKSFLKSKVDYLFIGKYLIEKP